MKRPRPRGASRWFGRTAGIARSAARCERAKRSREDAELVLGLPLLLHCQDRDDHADVEDRAAEVGDHDLPLPDQPEVGFVDEAATRHRRVAADRLVHAAPHPRGVGRG